MPSTVEPKVLVSEPRPVYNAKGRSAGLRRACAIGLAVALAVLSGGCCGENDANPDATIFCNSAHLGDGPTMAARSTLMATAGQAIYIPGAAHVTGANGTNWRSDVEVQAAGGSSASYTVELFKRDQSNNSPASKSFQLTAGHSIRYSDILGSMFGFSGAGALRIMVNAGSVVVTSRTYNQTSSGTYGQFIAGALSGATIGSSQHGRLIQLSQSTSSTSGYRANLGLVNTTGMSFSVRADLYRADGSFLGSKSYPLDPYEMRQIDKIFTKVTSASVQDGYAVVSTTTSGASFFAYGSVVDNATGDPVYVPATPLAGPPPTGGPSPTPTPTPGGADLNLQPYTPPGWDGPLVVSGTTETNSSGGLNGGWGTYIDWSFVNYGSADAVFPAGKYIVSLLLDGNTLINFNSSSEFVLEGGYYYHYEDWETYDIDSGHHTVEMVIDPQHVVAESNEGDNTASYSGDWTFVGKPARDQRSLRVIDVPISSLRREPIPVGRSQVRAAATAGSTSTLYIPASAHATGFGGAVWRTDVELHNAGSTSMSCTIDLLKKDTSNASPASRQYTIQAGHALRLGDILESKFSVSGLAALRLRLSGGTGVVTSRTYNQTSHGTYGQFIGAVPDGEAVGNGQQAALIQLTHNRSTTNGFRTNIGLLNCTTSPIDVTIDLYKSGGSKLGSVAVRLQALGFTQVDKLYERVTGSDVGDGYAMVSTSTSSGRFLAYASVIDNRTGDPIYIPAVPTSGGGGVSGTMGPGELVSVIDALEQALKAATGNDLGSVLVSDLNNGLDATLDAEANLGNRSVTVTRVNKGIRIEVSGGTSSGTFTDTYSGYTHTSTGASWDFHDTISDLVVGGRAVPFTSNNGHVSAVKNGSAVAADITINASGPNASAAGTVHMDTSVCTTAPISGSVDITVGSTTSTVTFTNDCGVYTINTPGSVGLRFQNDKNSQWQYIPVTCSDGFHTTAPTFDFYALTDGPLSASPTGVAFSKCLTGLLADGGYVSGNATESALHLDFTIVSSLSGDDWTYRGSYDGTQAQEYGYGVFTGTLRVHASGGYKDCQGDLVITDKIVGGCGMSYGALPICNGASSCQ